MTDTDFDRIIGEWSRIEPKPTLRELARAIAKATTAKCVEACEAVRRSNDNASLLAMQADDDESCEAHEQNAVGAIQCIEAIRAAVKP